MLTEKIKVVLDTNIIISAFISPFGASAEIFELFLKGNIVNYTSKEIIEELARVICMPKFIGSIENYDKGFMIDNFRLLSVVIEPALNEKVVKADPEDDKLINCAQSVGAILISGDHHLLGLGAYKNVLILSPREFLERLK